MLNFYQINGDGEIRTRDRLVIKALIPCQRTILTQKLRNSEIRTRDRLVIKALIPYQRTISTQKFKFLGEVPGYDLYYSLTKIYAFLKLGG